MRPARANTVGMPQELAEAFMERFPEDPILFATEDWRGDRD